MEELSKLSNREWDVLKHLLQGKSNKLIASSLHISVRTVEFHLKNIYTKFQVRSRIELILKLWNTTGWIKPEKLVRSTVVGKWKLAENRGKPNLWTNWVILFKETVSIIGKELEMKYQHFQHIFKGVLTTLFAGLLWFAVLKYSPNLSIALAVVLAVSGLIVGAIGKQQGESFFKILFSVLLGTGFSPIVAIPLMIFAVVPIGRLFISFGIISLSAIPTKITTNIAEGIMLALWLIASIALGIIMLKLSTIIQLQLTSVRGQIERSV